MIIELLPVPNLVRYWVIKDLCAVLGDRASKFSKAPLQILDLWFEIIELPLLVAGSQGRH
jgi:hypothetical protein